jgi:diguanylate cyclase (GGDEF)-like protein
MAWTFSIDALLAPFGLCAVIATRASPAAIALAGAPVLLVTMLSRDRIQNYEQAVTLGEAFEAVREEARVDSLTGLANRRAWQEAVGEAEALVQERGAVVTVVMADLDHLKAANDTYGHETGDLLISTFATVFAARAPSGATAARIGGDEFGLVHVGPGFSGPAFIAAVRADLAEQGHIGPVALSASFGFAVCRTGPIARAIAAADEMAVDDKRARRVARHA